MEGSNRQYGYLHYAHFPEENPHFDLFPGDNVTIPDEPAFQCYYNQNGTRSKVKVFIWNALPLLTRIENIAKIAIPVACITYLPSLAPPSFALILISGQTLLSLTAFFVACIAVKCLFNKILQVISPGDYPLYLETQITHYLGLDPRRQAIAMLFAKKLLAYNNTEIIPAVTTAFEAYLITKITDNTGLYNNVDTAIQYAYKIPTEAVHNLQLDRIALCYDQCVSRELDQLISSNLTRARERARCIQSPELRENCLAQIELSDLRMQMLNHDVTVRQQIPQTAIAFASTLQFPTIRDPWLLDIAFDLLSRIAPDPTPLPVVFELITHIEHLFDNDHKLIISNLFLEEFIVKMLRCCDRRGYQDPAIFRTALDTILLSRDPQLRSVRLTYLANAYHSQGLHQQAENAESVKNNWNYRMEKYVVSEKLLNYAHAKEAELLSLLHSFPTRPGFLSTSEIKLTERLLQVEGTEALTNIQKQVSSNLKKIRQELFNLEYPNAGDRKYSRIEYSDEEESDVEEIDGEARDEALVVYPPTLTKEHLILLQDHYTRIKTYCKHLRKLNNETFPLFNQTAYQNTSFAIRALAYFHAKESQIEPRQIKSS